MNNTQTHHGLKTFSYSLAVPQDARRTLAMAWLGLGMAALVASGLFSVLLVLSRTPQLQAYFPVVDFFRVALVSGTSQQGGAGAK